MKSCAGDSAPGAPSAWARSTSSASPRASWRRSRERGARPEHAPVRLRGGPPLLGGRGAGRGERGGPRPAHRPARPPPPPRRGYGDRPRRAQARRHRGRRRALRPRRPERRRGVPGAGPDDGEHRRRGLGAPGAEARRRSAGAGPRVGGPDALRRVLWRCEMIGDPVVELTRVYHASAAHRLAHPALSDAANASVYGACARPHGHNYYIEVTVAGRPDPVTGMAVDLDVVVVA